MVTFTDADGCQLCGLPLSDATVTLPDGTAFCCSGCRHVHTTIDDFEDIDPETITDPPDTPSRTDPPPANANRAYFEVDGMHCTTCETFLETIATRNEGISHAAASYVTDTVRLDYDPTTYSHDDLSALLSTAGYHAYPRDDQPAERHAKNQHFARLITGVVFGMLVMMQYAVLIYPTYFNLLYDAQFLAFISHALATPSGQYFFAILFILTTIILFYTGGPILRGALVSLRTRQPNMDLLIALAASSAYLYSTIAFLLGRTDIYFDVTVAIIVVVTLGNHYETTIKQQATSLLTDLATTHTDTATRYHSNGPNETIPLDDLDPNDLVIVQRGERIPLDGTLTDGTCTVDEAVITGESLPVTKHPGDTLVGGAIIIDGIAIIDIGPTPTNSLDRITDLVWDLQTTTSGIQQLADKLATIFVPLIITIAVLVSLLYIGTGAPFTRALLVGLTILIVSCPCALGLATPLAVAAGIRDAMKHNIVVFDETVFERLREIDIIAFDKTGTLTTGDMRIIDSYGPDELFAAAAELEQHSPHPVANAITTEFSSSVRPDGGISSTTVTDYEHHSKGVSGTIGHDRILVGHPDLFATENWSIPPAIAERVHDTRTTGRIPVVIGRNGTAEAIATVGDEYRAEWDDTVASLRARGMEIVILTGDDSDATEPLSQNPNIDHVFTDIPPEGKAATIQRLAATNTVAMVGDGTNDAPALALADLGIALGSGTALAADAADIAIVNDDLSMIETVFALSGRAGRRVKTNIAWAFLYNLIAIPLAVFGLLNPLFAAAAMATSSLLVVTNSSRPLIQPNDEHDPTRMG